MDDCHDSSLLPFGNPSNASNLSPALQQYAMNLYRRAWTDYREVGCPYGETDKAMLVWYTFQKEGSCPAPFSSRN